MAKPTPASDINLLVTELWGLGDLAVAIPFLRAASQHVSVSLLAKPHAEPLLRHFVPGITLIPFEAPWTAFRGKYRFHRWPWQEIRTVRETLQRRDFSHVVSARPDLREHLFICGLNIAQRIGFPRLGSGLCLNKSLPIPAKPHRHHYWQTLAKHFHWTLPPSPDRPTDGRHLLIHTGAAQSVRRWPRERFEQLADQLRTHDWRVTLIDETHGDLDQLIATLATADRFIGNDSGPGHIAALLGIPTFTVFGPQLPENFAPVHPRAAWIEGVPCPHKPCYDNCRFDRPHCLLDLSTNDVAHQILSWLEA